MEEVNEHEMGKKKLEKNFLRKKKEMKAMR